jgi:hypothetical protein
MYIAIDRVNMRITHVHPDSSFVSGLAYLEAAHVRDVRIESTLHEGFLSVFNPLELERLHFNLTGESYRGADAAYIIAALCDKLVPPKVVSYELDAQIALIQKKDLCEKGVSFRYVYGKTVPSDKMVEVAYKVKALSEAEMLAARARVWIKQRVLPPLVLTQKGMLNKSSQSGKETEMSEVDNAEAAAAAAAAKAEKAKLAADTKAAKAEAALAAKNAKAAEKQAAADAKLKAAEAKVAAKAAAEEAKAKVAAEKEAAKAARQMPSQNGVTRPSATGACGAAWEVFDAISAQKKLPATIKEALEIGRTRQLNESTIKTQYARWRKFHGIAGRLAEPAAEAA